MIIITKVLFNSAQSKETKIIFPFRSGNERAWISWIEKEAVGYVWNNNLNKNMNNDNYNKNATEK